MNAEVSLGTVTSIDEAIIWLGFTYLNTRIRKNPLAYGAQIQQVKDEASTRNFIE